MCVWTVLGQNQDMHEMSQSSQDVNSRSVNCDKHGLTSLNSIHLSENVEKVELHTLLQNATLFCCLYVWCICSLVVIYK